VWMHTQNNITNINLQYSSNLCHCYNYFMDHLSPMVHFSQSAMLHCRVIPTKHTELIGCRSQLHPVCPCKCISDSTLSKSSLTVPVPRGWIVWGGNGRISKSHKIKDCPVPSRLRSLRSENCNI
jgi:hypothetical protein